MHSDFLVEALRDRGTRDALEPGQTLFVEGQRDARVFLVESGSIEIGIGSPDGQRLTLNVLRSGEVFGEIAMLDNGVRTADAVARESSYVVSLSRRRFFSLFASPEEAYEFVVQLLCGRLRWINRQTEYGRLCSARTMLASRLLMLSEGETNEWIGTSQEKLAASAGLTREHANHILREWRAAGVIDTRRGGVKVTSQDALIELANVHV